MGDVIPFRGTDRLRSVVSGLGNPGRDKLAGSFYGSQCLDDWQLANIYRSNWIGRIPHRQKIQQLSGRHRGRRAKVPRVGLEWLTAPIRIKRLP
jgi:hypothetical protein